MKAVADKLREARALVAQGWTQGAFEQDDGNVTCYCTVGAMIAVGRGESYGLAATFKRVIGERNIYDWNDEPGRTKAEVLAAFDKAIELAEAGQ